MRNWIQAIMAVGFLVALSGCNRSNNANFKNMHLDSSASWGETKAYYMAKAMNDPGWQKQWWIEKTVRVLRAGKGLGPDENIAEYMALTEDEIIQKLMSDARMTNMVLDFNMYFLGFKIDSLWKSTGTFNGTVYDFPSAISSALEVQKSGDYFKLFDLYAPIYLGHPTVQKMATDNGKSDYQIVQEHILSIQTVMQGLLTEASPGTTKAPMDVCTDYSQQSVQALQDILDMGMSLTFYLNVFSTSPQVLKLQTLCYSSNTPPAMADLLKALTDLNTAVNSVLAQYLSFAAPTYMPQLLSEVNTFDLSAVGQSDQMLSYRDTQRNALPNSSTNYNRKRSAYILKQFFCDDLNPVGVEDTGGPPTTNGPHGSTPACYACHYKLDPMAGFFRNLGASFFDYSGQNYIIFDDGASATLSKYTTAWLAPSGSKRTWNVGYIRSVSDESLNTYGDKLDDLNAMFRTAPEVKSCLVRRLFEYLVDPNQTVDGSYLDYLTTEMTKRAKTNSSDAFKWTVEQILLSQSYNTMNLDPTQCYDYAPGYKPNNAPPCRVAYLLKQNCTSCHDSTKAHANLDLSHWTKLPDGTYNFPDLDANGKQQDVQYTMGAIVDRLSTPDDTERMPLGKYMSSQDRQDLYLWAQGMIPSVVAKAGAQ